MKKSYSKPRLKTEAFTPQEAITACWISTLKCQCSSYSGSPYLYPRPSDHNDPKIATLSSHPQHIFRVTINTEGDAAPTISPIQQFYSEGLFNAYASSRDPFNKNHTGTQGYAWPESSTSYHFTTSQPTNWEKNQS